MRPTRLNAPLTSDLADPSAIPYFLWDEPMTVADLQKLLAAADVEQRSYWLGKVLREARDTDVWMFTSPREVASLWPRLHRYLGRRRPFWEFLFRLWRDEGLIGG
jgi:hypothetical protein